MSHQIEVHGYKFGIDTADWGNNCDSAEKAADYLADALGALEYHDTKALHCALSIEQLDRSSAEQAVVDNWDDEANNCRTRVMDEEQWVSSPDVGHNLSIYAVQS